MPELDATIIIAAARQGITDAKPENAKRQAQSNNDASPTDWATRARVRIWQRGWIIGESEASAPDTLVAVRTAAARAATDREEEPEENPVEKQAPAPHDAPQFHNEFEDQPEQTKKQSENPPTFLEIETVDQIEPIQPAGLSGLIQSISPPREGCVLSNNGRTVGGWPTDPIHAAEPIPYWLKGLLKQARPPGYWLPESVDVQRFTARRLVALIDQPPTTGPDALPDPTFVFDGDTQRVTIEDVTHDSLIRAAVQAGAWLGRHQLPNGLFRYEYVPQLDEWSRVDSIVRQAGCAWSMARLARSSRETPFVASASRAVAAIIKTGLQRKGAGNLVAIADSGGRLRLGAIPLAVLALSEIEGPHGARGPDSPTEDLTATLLALQDHSGAFGTTVRGTELEGTELYYAGQCTLALARRYTLTKRDRLADAVRAAIGHYSDWWSDDANKDLSFLAWMIQACELADSIPATAGAADFAYDMADWAIERQYPTSHPTLGWAGGFEGGPGIGTAAYTEGIAAAWAIALRRGDTARAARYRDSTLQAQRFLLQLQLAPADLVFVRSPGHRGAIRRSLRSRSLRCDNAQHFLMAALRTASLLDQEQRGSQDNTKGEPD